MNPRFHEIRDSVINCLLCPNFCRIKPGKSGICGVRANGEKKGLTLPYYGIVSAAAVDPIEKKPLYHYYPGSSIFSVGFLGCSLRCPFCQNYRISQSTSAGGQFIAPEALADMALDHKSFALAYTYSEPLIHAEYIIEASKTARGRGLKNVLVTNGYVNPEPAEEILEFADAANIDLKCFSDDFYKKELGGRLDPVLAFISRAAERIHVEITTLIIPGKNDSEGEIEEIARFIASLDKTIPLHLSCYYPTYKYSIRATAPPEVLRLKDIARKHLVYVYPGNVGLEETDTCCPSCGSVLVRRVGYSITIKGVTEGACAACGHRIPIAGI